MPIRTTTCDEKALVPWRCSSVPRSCCRRYHLTDQLLSILGLQINEINYWMPMTCTFGSNTLWSESQPGKGDFRPFELQPGDLVQFWYAAALVAESPARHSPTQW